MMRSNITLAQSYELFGLKSVGSIDEVKKIYRQIAKQLHPDLNPQDPTARDRFNHLNQAYQLLLAAAETATSYAQVELPVNSSKDYTVTSVRVNHVVDRTLSPQDLQLKQSAFDNLQKLMSQDDFLAAVLMIDRLVTAIPNYTEISKKQSEVYFKYAQDLIKQRRQINLARNYLKSSLKIDPHNQQRWEAVNREFNRIERMIK
jgi:tetratricopeptide (TPR) repeat protein